MNHKSESPWPFIYLIICKTNSLSAVFLVFIYLQFGSVKLPNRDYSFNGHYVKFYSYLGLGQKILKTEVVGEMKPLSHPF